MSKHDNGLEDFRNFPGITEAWELVKTGVIVIGDQLYTVSDLGVMASSLYGLARQAFVAFPAA